MIKVTLKVRQNKTVSFHEKMRFCFQKTEKTIISFFTVKVPAFLSAYKSLQTAAVLEVLKKLKSF